jgi:hypothetical protein
MFSSSFYNAGFTIESILDFKPFMEGIHHSKYPKMIIISLDQWMFNSNWDAMEKPRKPKDYCKTSYQFIPSVGVLKMTLKDISKRKYRLKDLLNDEETCKIGLQAKVNNKGFRNDGSMTEGSDIQKRLNNDQTLEDFGFRNTLKRIELGINRFERGDTLNTKSLKVLDEFLSFCHQHQIEVISFLPPFAQSVNEALEKSGRHNYIANIEKAVRPIVENYGFELWNFQHLNLHGISDKDMIDGFHGGEQVHVKMLLHMLGNNSIIKKHTRENLLQNALNKQKSTFEVLPY